MFFLCRVFYELSLSKDKHYNPFCPVYFSLSHTLIFFGVCTLADAQTCYHANCQYGCEVIKGAVRCTCPSPGLRLGPDRRTCVGMLACFFKFLDEEVQDHLSSSTFFFLFRHRRVFLGWRRVSSSQKVREHFRELHL